MLAHLNYLQKNGKFKMKSRKAWLKQNFRRKDEREREREWEKNVILLFEKIYG